VSSFQPAFSVQISAGVDTWAISRQLPGAFVRSQARVNTAGSMPSLGLRRMYSDPLIVAPQATRWSQALGK
jgi:hypothetical protein